jgi:hypothetical protein
MGQPFYQEEAGLEIVGFFEHYFRSFKGDVDKGYPAGK